jgi:ribosome-binding factor A
MSGSPRGRTPRQLRVGEELRHALDQVLRRAHVRDPDLQGASITVTEVRVSPDLRAATAFVLPLAGRNADVVLAALQRAAPFLRGELARAVRLRVAPTLAFALDASFDEAERIERALASPSVRRDLDRDER